MAKRGEGFSLNSIFPCEISADNFWNGGLKPKRAPANCLTRFPNDSAITGGGATLMGTDVFTQAKRKRNWHSGPRLIKIGRSSMRCLGNLVNPTPSEPFNTLEKRGVIARPLPPPIPNDLSEPSCVTSTKEMISLRWGSFVNTPKPPSFCRIHRIGWFRAERLRNRVINTLRGWSLKANGGHLSIDWGKFDWENTKRRKKLMQWCKNTSQSMISQNPAKILKRLFITLKNDYSPRNTTLTPFGARFRRRTRVNQHPCKSLAIIVSSVISRDSTRFPLPCQGEMLAASPFSPDLSTRSRRAKRALIYGAHSPQWPPHPVFSKTSSYV